MALAMTFVASGLAALLAHRLISKPTLQLQSTAEGLAEGQEVYYRPTWMAEVNVVGRALASASHVISKREAALHEREHQLSVVVKELSHRTKNLLAVIQAMARQTMKGANSLHLNSFQQRLVALARSNDLLVGSGWSSVELEDLVRTQTETFRPHGEDKIKCEGPSLLLRPEAAQSIGMALHELATNSVKYGALSSQDGWVDVTWETFTEAGGNSSLRFRWKEEEGPQCVPPNKSGFGHSILTKVVPASLNGRASLQWHKNGCEWVLEVAIRELASDRSSATAREASVADLVG